MMRFHLTELIAEYVSSRGKVNTFLLCSEIRRMYERTGVGFGSVSMISLKFGYQLKEKIGGTGVGIFLEDWARGTKYGIDQYVQSIGITLEEYWNTESNDNDTGYRMWVLNGMLKDFGDVEFFIGGV